MKPGQRPFRLLTALGIAATAGALVGRASAADALPPIVQSRPIDGSGAAAGGSQGAAATAAPLTLEQRVAKIERLVESQTLLDMLQRLDALQQEVQQLRGMVEEQGHTMDGLTQRQRELYLDIDRRIRQVEVAVQASAGAGASPGGGAATAGTIAGAAAGTAAGAATAAGSAAAATVASDPLAEQAAYQQAFNVLKEGHYEESVKALGDFLKRYPNSEYASNAQYWIGEANYVMRRFPDAIKEFNKVIDKFPDSSKTPDAMLKLGYTYYEVEDWAHANEVLNELVKRFPDTTAAQLAQNRLHRMKLENH